MALGSQRPQPPPLQLVRGAARSRPVVYREGLLFAPRAASLRAARGVPGNPPSAIRLDAFERMVAAELHAQLQLERGRRGVLCLSAAQGTAALQRALRFARMLGLSGWESRAGSFARLSEPTPKDLHTVVTWLCAGETSCVALLRGREALQLTVRPDARLHIAACEVTPLDETPDPRRPLPSPLAGTALDASTAEDALFRWARAGACTPSLTVQLAPALPRVCPR